MRKILLVAASQIVFFYYFMWMFPPTHIQHMIFDTTFNWMVLTTMAIGILLNVGFPKDAFINVVSPPLSIWIIGDVLDAMRPMLFGKILFTPINVAVFYVTLAVIWFVIPWAWKSTFDLFDRIHGK